MAVSSELLSKLAEALGQPSRAYRAATEALNIPKQAAEGYKYGAGLGDEIRKRRLATSKLSDVLGAQLPSNVPGDLTVEGATELTKPLEAYASLEKALHERTANGQLVGFDTGSNKGLVYTPGQGLSTIDNPATGPILPRAVTPTVTPYATPGGQPLSFTPGKGLSPVPNAPGVNGTPVVKQGNEQAINDTALMQSQAGNIDKLFNAYKTKSPAMARVQATPAGGVLDPETAQLENSLKLAAFTFGGKNLTEGEKRPIYAALFPSWTDNDASRELKRGLLKDYFSGKIDLLQAANLLGPAGAPLKAMLQSKLQQQQPQNNTTGDPEADAAIQKVMQSNISEQEKQARISGIRAAASRK